MTIVVSDDAGAIALPRAVAIEGLCVAPRDAALDAAIRAAESALRVDDPARELATARTRAMYRRFGVDPTRTRPSSEALLRRVRKGDRLPAINNLVDVVNWCSVESQVPFGLYDRASLRGEVALRLGLAGEGYEGIRKDRVNVAGRLVLVDGDGPFGNPTSDSARAMVTASTQAVLVVLFTPPDLPAGAAAGLADVTRARIEQYGRAAAQ